VSTAAMATPELIVPRAPFFPRRRKGPRTATVGGPWGGRMAPPRSARLTCGRRSPRWRPARRGC
jgi:hypothetical protein